MNKRRVMRDGRGFIGAAGRGLSAHTGESTRLATLLAAHVDQLPELLTGYVACLPDEAAALDRLWRDLARSPHPPASGRIATWEGPVTAEKARHLLYLLVQLDGWHRIKECAQEGCDRPFVDASNPGTRKFCSRHTRRRPS